MWQSVVFSIGFSKGTRFILTYMHLVGNFLNFVLRTSRPLRDFSTLLSPDFLNLLDTLGKRLKFDINIQQGFKKVLNGLLNLSFY